MTVTEFIRKWKKSELRERQAAQEHFVDLCNLVGHPTPAEMDPLGDRFCFERGASKTGGGDGWADVWKRNYFGWEYKGKHKDLKEAYKQLLDYREALGNPPLLIVCDMDRFEIHTNFTNTEATVHTLRLDDIESPEALRLLRNVFFDPEQLRPMRPRQVVTEKAAAKVGQIAHALRGRGVDAQATARFLDRLVFCMFAEDVGLLPNDVFTKSVRAARQNPARFGQMVGQLYQQMAHGGFFGAEEIRRFNGHLFDSADVIALRPDEIGALDALSAMDWSEIEPAIFGSLFERGLDPDSRAQIGAHYTSREDIETLVEPVVMQPLRREWEELRQLVLNVLRTGKKRPTGKEKPLGNSAAKKAAEETRTIIRNFLDRLAFVKVLDPACGSGNFLYVTLHKLLDLEREICAFADAHGVGPHFPRVNPGQLYGIEINPYAHELAQMTVWIGYLQWMNQHGYPWPADPVLKPLDTFRCMDAILDLSDPDNPAEPDWPAVDFIVGNPPFLGTKKLRSGLSNEYVERLFDHYGGRIPNFSDLCCYWFEKARAQIETGKCKRGGLLATQGIRGGLNRTVLQRIKSTGDIFWAESDRPWVLDGANVHVSMVGFDDGTEQPRTLDGQSVTVINANLTAAVNIAQASRMLENARVAFIADVKAGRFDLPEADALALLNHANPNGRPNSDVLVPWVNGQDVLRRWHGYWIIDFGCDTAEEAAAKYEQPFERIQRLVKPERDKVQRENYAKLWWLHARPGHEMRRRLHNLPRFIVTPTVAKHRAFAWLEAPTLPDHQLVAIARSDDYLFGVLHSRAHELWALRLGTRLETRPRYTPTTCFETFPFPWPPGQEPEGDPRVHAIANAASELNKMRENWLNPSEWTRHEMLEFPGSVEGPWARYVHDPDARGIGTVRWPRLIPRNAECAKKLKGQTLTNLYNARPTWLTNAHDKLDAAVFAAYDWEVTVSDDELLALLLALNLDRARSEPE